MALNETVRNYFPGSTIDIMIEIVANHGGLFNFEMCWRQNLTIKESEDCFEPLHLSPESQKHAVGDLETSGNEFDYVLDSAAGTGMFTLSVKLPEDKTCDKCIMRWHWRSANNWGVCDDGSEGIGCGYQEIYRNCADVSVKQNGSGIGLGFNSRRKRRK